MKNKRTKAILACCFCLLLIAGLALIIIPSRDQIERDTSIRKQLHEWKDAFPNKGSIQTPADEPILYPELLAAMQQYNQDIWKNDQSGLVDAWSYQSELFDLSAYGVSDDVVGCITISSIDVSMPLYLGANEQNLSKGFAQLSQTSMPIGGNNTNCVVACHRGYDGSAFLRDADQIQEGDIVTLQNFWQTLTYRVCEPLKVIEPHEIEEILIQPNRDLLTIVTCTPYRVGSHRLIVICERIESE